jgi:hypothetical protein
LDPHGTAPPPPPPPPPQCTWTGRYPVDDGRRKKKKKRRRRLDAAQGAVTPPDISLELEHAPPIVIVCGELVAKSIIVHCNRSSESRTYNLPCSEYLEVKEQRVSEPVRSQWCRWSPAAP